MYPSENKSDFNILLVENSRTTRAVLDNLLKREGYNVSSVANGKDAISTAQKDDIHLILMDLYMPQLNGYEAAKEIRNLPSPKGDMPIIAITASTDQQDIDICKQAGMNEYFFKTHGDTELLNIIEKYRTEGTS